MAQFNINFQGKIGQAYKIGYRTYDTPINTYIIIDYTASANGLQTVPVSVPGSLYCAYDGIEYTGYVLPTCLSDADTNGDGIPDLASLWMVMLNHQIDECVKAEISCDWLSLNTDNVVILSAGATCAPDGDYPVLLATVNPADTIENGAITATVVGGSVTEITITNPGKYLVSPNLSIPTLTCGTTPALKAYLGPEGTTIDLQEFVCKGTFSLNGTDSLYAIPVGESIVIFSTMAKLGNLPAEYIPTGMTTAPTAHCTECQSETIVVAATTGEGRILYQTCWDGSNSKGNVNLISDKLTAGVDLVFGCILDETVIIEQGTLDVVPTKTVSNCV